MTYHYPKDTPRSIEQSRSHVRQQSYSTAVRSPDRPFHMQYKLFQLWDEANHTFQQSICNTKSDVFVSKSVERALVHA